MANETRLSPPWITYLNEIKAMFGDDPEIRIVWEEADKEIKLYVSDVAKASALDALLNGEKEFGNIILKITVIPPNADEIDMCKIYETAFNKNPAFEESAAVNTPFGTYRFVVFRNKVVQFFNDEMTDINGNKSTLYQDIAKDIFDSELALKYGVSYCTATNDYKLMKPLGEWP